MSRETANSRRSHMIRLILQAQKRAQRHAGIESMRRLARWGERLPPTLRHVRRETIDHDGLTYEWLIPKEPGSEKVILYIHGGGFVLPLCNPSRLVAARLARTTGMRTLLVRYRLAPDHPFPAALEDCVGAYRWLTRSGATTPEQVVMAGESAGGNLVVTAMLSLRDFGDPLPSAGVCICPVFDFEGSGSFREQDDPMIHADLVTDMLDAYRGSADPRHPRLSPLYGDLCGLPPLLIQTGELEILRSGAEGLAARAEEAGVPTTLEVWPGMWHYWHMFVRTLPEARDALGSVGDFLRSLP